MRILELLRIFRVIADLPDFGDKEAVRAWLLKLCDVAKLLTDRTPTPADDAVLAFLERSIADEEAVRAWLLKLCDIAGLLTERTPTEADDAVLAFLERSIADEKLFGPIFDLLTALLASDEPAPPTATQTLATEATAAGIDPVTILAIVEAVVGLIRLIRERRGK